MQQFTHKRTLIYVTNSHQFRWEKVMYQNLQQIKKAKSGDAEAFADLYRSIYADLYRFALYTLKNPTDAEDAVSETVMDAFTSIHKLRSEASFKTWIFQILSIKCKRRFLEYKNFGDELTTDIPDKEISHDLAADIDLRNCFFGLKDDERLIISMHIFAGYTSREIAKVLHMNANTVRSKESRALKKLSEQLSDSNKKER